MPVEPARGSVYETRCVDAVIGLGSNLGSREAFLRVAARLLDGHHGVRVVATSGLYATPPLGPPQPDFLNAAVRVRTELGPLELLAVMQQVEADLGRVREVRWGPRTIDLDLLWWFGGEVDEPTLRVPHPGLRERAFALAPLLDVAPELAGELGEALAALPTPRGEPWSILGRLGARTLAIDALDGADALALAVNALTNDAPKLAGLEKPDDEPLPPARLTPAHLEAESLDALARALGRDERVPAWVVIETNSGGGVVARIGRDPRPDRKRLGTLRLEPCGRGVRAVLATS